MHAARSPAQWDCSLPRLLLWLGLFAAAFGYVEAAVAHYLRLHLYPGGFDDSIALVVDRHTLAVEAGREICTLIVLAAAAALGPGPLARRLASFVYGFAIWDLSYYAALWLFEGWPSSAWDWDLLFLLPVPWFGPVWAPMLISLLGICGAVALHIAFARRGTLVFPGSALLAINAALLAWELSFTVYALSDDGMRRHFPAEYHWELLALGAALALAGGLLIARRNRAPRATRDAEPENRAAPSAPPGPARPARAQPTSRARPGSSSCPSSPAC